LALVITILFLACIALAVRIIAPIPDLARSERINAVDKAAWRKG
jgi:hypothetical protein